MSKKRQSSRHGQNEDASGTTVRSFAVRHFHDHVIASHSHEWHQLIYASEGVMWVHTAAGDWVVPPNRAVWVPAGVEHGIELTGEVLVQTIYLATGIPGDLPRHCSAVNVSPLLRELIVHTVKLRSLDQSEPAHARLIGFLVDQLSVLPTIPLQLPLPRDIRARWRCRLVAGAPRRCRSDQVGGPTSCHQRPHARADFPGGNGNDFRPVAAAASAPPRDAPAGRRPAGDCGRPRGGVREPERLHRHVQTHARYHPPSLLRRLGKARTNGWHLPNSITSRRNPAGQHGDAAFSRDRRDSRRSRL